MVKAILFCEEALFVSTVAKVFLRPQERLKPLISQRAGGSSVWGLEPILRAG